MSSLLNRAGHDPHLNPLPQGEEKKLCARAINGYVATSFGTVEISREPGHDVGATFIHKRDGNLRSRLIEA